MITNIGEGIQFFCGNHDELIPLKIMSGMSEFYACPKYMRKDDEHPDGYENGERACLNRLSFDDAGNILMALSELIAKSYEEGEFADFTNVRFQCKHYDVKVLLYSDDKIHLSVINRRAAR